MNEPDDKAPLFAPAGHFYSPVTHQRAVRKYLGSEHYQRQIAHTDALIDLGAMAALWHQFQSDIIGFPCSNRLTASATYGRNNQFEYYDASILSGLLAALKSPAKSSRLARGFRQPRSLTRSTG